jgi:hypothetical protein
VAANQGLGPSHGLLAGFEVKALGVETQDYLGAGLQPQGLAHLDRDHQSASLANACHVLAHVAQLTTLGTSDRIAVVAKRRKHRSMEATTTSSPPSGLEAIPGEPLDRPLDVLPKLLPELSLALAFLAAAIFPDRVGPRVRETMDFVVLVEVLFCMGQGTLTDIATRLRKPPPWWLGLLILGGLLLFNVQVLGLTTGLVREGGWLVALPFLWSLVERGRELWTMPRASRLEKLRRRALVSGRISLVLIGGGVAIAAMGLSYLVDDVDGGGPFVERYAAWGLAVLFGLAAFDVWRVHRPAFARRPRALFGAFDPLRVTDLSRI